jgi:saccharopine dehydrogenase-like NADP-dependent oxidoreductase
MFVQLGMTDDEYTIDDSENMSYRDFVNAFLPYSPTDSVELKFRHALKIDQDDIVWDKLLELDLFSNKKMVELKKATPAQILQKILEDSWTLNEDEKDMIVMYHKFGYELDGKKYQIDSTMVTLGEDKIYTAMSKTVGLPVAIAALAILNEKIVTPGVQIPISKEVYEPILNELEEYGITFTETQVPYLGYNPLNL